MPSTTFTSPWRKSQGLSAEAAEFVPPSSFSANATEFVPSFSAAAPEFVPRWKKAEEEYQAPAAPQVQCCISFDAYTDDSESDDEPGWVAPAPTPAPAATARPWKLTATEFVPQSVRLAAECKEEPSGSESPIQVDKADNKKPCPWRRTQDASPAMGVQPVNCFSTLSTSQGSDSAAGSSDESTSSESCASRTHSPVPAASKVQQSEQVQQIELQPLTVSSLLQWRQATAAEPLGMPFPTAAEPEAGTPEAAFAAAAARAAAKGVDGPESPQLRPQQKSPQSRPDRRPKDTSRVWGRAQELSMGEEKSWRGEPAKKLEVSEDSWTAKQRARRNTDHASASDAELVRTMKSLLNKLTVDKFDKISNQLINCGVRSAIHMEILIQEVFEKATTQHHFIDMYADLCVLLNKEVVIESTDPKITFKKILLNCCQASFEKRSAPLADLSSLSTEERTAAERMYKMRMLGNIRFVGSLFVRRMLASKVMLGIMEELLQEPTGEALESLAAFLTVVGPHFDTPEWSYRATLSAVFAQVDQLTKKSSISSRSKCLLKDVLDLRKQGWNDKKPKKIEGPLKLDEVAAKAAKENGDQIKSPSHGNEWATIGTPRQWKQGYSPTSNVEKGYQNVQAQTEKTSKGTGAGLAMLDFLKNRDSNGQPKVETAKKTTPFDKEACRSEISATLTELRLSHDVSKAVARISNIGIPASHQDSELTEILAHLAEEGSESARKVGFDLAARLFIEKHWNADSATEGIRKFVEETCADLKCDVPALPKILRDELHPAMAPLVQAKLLAQEQHSSLLKV